MRLRKLTLRHFRNIGFAALTLSGRQQFFVGANGQGKTNLLEAAGFLTALRSFRATDNKLLIGHDQSSAAIACELDHEKRRETTVTITLRPDGKDVQCDQERVSRLADYLGQFPTVIFSSQDLQLIRGAPAGRRRWVDLTLAAMDAGYLRTLQTYSRALAGRNALLKRGQASDAEVTAFEHTLAPAAAQLVALRDAGLRGLQAAVQRFYSQLCDDCEPAEIRYAPHCAETSGDAWVARFESGRMRDRQFRSTLTGPHRDEFLFFVRATPARDFASEGQQRSLVLALRLAQAAWFHEKSGVRPVLLADDVLGELDPERRRRFWTAIDPESQVMATGTRLPEAALGAWQIFVVADGTFTETAPATGEAS